MVKELRLTPCYRAGLRKGSERAKFQSPMMGSLIGAVYYTALPEPSSGV
jgi:hypothetical protein